MKKKKALDVLYIVFHILNIIFCVCAFTFCLFVCIASLTEGRMWPEGVIWLSLCVVIVWTGIRDIKLYIRDKGRENKITLPAPFGTRIYFVPKERNQVECGEIIGGADDGKQVYMILERRFPLDEGLPDVIKVATNSTFFYNYEEANAHLADLMPKITAAEAAKRISEAAYKAGETMNDASRAQAEIIKAMKEAQGYAEN